MTFSSTLLFYLIVGVSVAIAIWLAGDAEPTTQRCGKSAAAVLFWPIFLPLLLGGDGNDPEPRDYEDAVTRRPDLEDGMSLAVRQVESELAAALASLDDWSEGVLSKEFGRIEELRLAWRAQAERVRELDQLLESPGFKESAISPLEAARDELGWDRSTSEARRENIARLRQVREQLKTDLMATLAWVRELVTMIHLARFSGAPASRAEELVAQIAAAVEGLSEVSSWSQTNEPNNSTLVSP